MDIGTEFMKAEQRTFRGENKRNCRHVEIEIFETNIRVKILVLAFT